MAKEVKEDTSVPTWNGEPDHWEDFVISLETFVKQREVWKEGQQIARIINRFDKKGKPWKLLVSLSEQERAKLTTKDALISYLKGNLLESAIPELGRHFRNWIKFRRDNGESMRVFILRHRKTLNKMESTLNLAQASAELKMKLRGQIDKIKLKILSEEHAARIRPKVPRKSKTWVNPKAPKSSEDTGAGVGDWESEEEEEDWREGYDDPGNPWQEDDKWSEGGWSSGSGWWKNSWWKDNSKRDESTQPEPVKDKTEELSTALTEVEMALEAVGKPKVMEKLLDLLSERWRERTIPDQLLGYHLLHASQLTATERSTILSTSQVQNRDATGTTTLKGNLNLDNIETALLTAWQDKELVERDQRESRKSDKRGKTFREKL